MSFEIYWIIYKIIIFVINKYQSCFIKVRENFSNFYNMTEFIYKILVFYIEICNFIILEVKYDY